MKKNLHYLVMVVVLLAQLPSMALTSKAADHNIWPERVTQMTCQWDINTGYVTISMIAPTHSMTSLGDGNGEPLPYLTKVVLSRNCNYGEYEEIYTFSNPQPGETLTYVDQTALAGLFQYKAVAYVDDYASYPEWCEVTVGQFPVDVNDAVATCNKGMAPVTLMFTAPGLDTEGNELAALEFIEISRFDHDAGSYVLLGNIDHPYPGQSCTFDDYDVVSGESYTYRITPGTVAGKAYGTIVNVMVGLDAPVAPTNVYAEELTDNRVQITWAISTLGQTNGYVNPDELTYTVMCSKTGSEYDAEVLATGIEWGYYLDETKYDEEAKLIYFVKAVNKQGESVGAASNPIIVGDPLTLPYSESFDAISEYGYVTSNHPGWLYESSETACAWYINDIVELETRNIETQTGEGGMAFAMYGNYNDLQQDDYMTSAQISLGNNDIFVVALDYYAFTGSNSTLTLSVSPDGAPFENIGQIMYEGMPQEGWSREAFIVDAYAGKRVKNIQLRLQAHKGTMAQPVIIDNVVVSELLPVENLRYDYENGLILWDAPAHLSANITGYVVSLNGINMATLSPEVTQYDFSNFKDESMLMFAITVEYEGKYLSQPAILDLTSVEQTKTTPLQVNVVSGVMHIATQEDTPVSVYSVDGTIVLSATGSVSKPLPSGLYIVKAGRDIVKVVI